MDLSFVCPHEFRLGEAFVAERAEGGFGLGLVVHFGLVSLQNGLVFVNLFAPRTLPNSAGAVSLVDLVGGLAVNDLAAVAAVVLLVLHCHVLVHRVGDDPAFHASLADVVTALFHVVIQLHPD